MKSLSCSTISCKFQPKLAALRRMSRGDSSKVTKMPGSSNCLMPLWRKCSENTVLPVPDVPLISVLRPIGRPPWHTSSKPSIPVGSF